MKFLTSTALALTMAAGSAGLAQAQDVMAPGVHSGVLAKDYSNRLIRSENIIGAQIYSLSPEYDDTIWNDTPYFDEPGADWENVGEVDDIVLSRDGRLVGIVAEVGGWLDIGDSEVVLSLDDLRTVGGTMEDAWGNLAFVTRLSEEQLEEMGDDSGWW